MRTLVAAAVASLLIVGLSQAEDVQASIKKTTSIPAQGLGAALQVFSEERKVHLVFISEDVTSVTTQGASGSLTAEETLAELLRGTGLTYKYLDEKTVTIVPVATGPGVKQEDKISDGKESQKTRSLWDRFRVAEADTATAAESTEGVKLEEIVVTAQKKEERLQDVPISISVLSGDKLDRSTSEGVAEALSRVPGVAVDTMFLGGGTQITVRGAAASGYVISGPNPVAYYLDSMPFGLVKTTVSPDANAYDLERVEVLRGPQGTLYGASALNGVVRILTKDADPNKFEFKVRGLTSSTKEGDQSYRGDMAINVPLIDEKLAIRGVLGYQDSSGWIDKANAKNANDAELLNVRFKLNAKPTERLSIGASVWLSRSDYGAPPSSADGKTSGSTVAEPIDTDYDAYGLKIGYDFSQFSIVSMTSYLHNTNDSVLDIAQGTASPFTLRSILEGKTFSEEVNLRSTHQGVWQWSVGGMYRDAKDHRQQELNFVPGGPGDVLDTSESVAVFGELTRLFLDRKLELTAGLRYFEDKVASRESADFGGVPLPYPTARSKFDDLSPRFIVTWHSNNQTTLYGSYAEGFRSGNNQSPTLLSVAPDFGSAKPDTLRNYELGAKGSRMNGRLDFDAALYYMDWKKVQQQLGVLYPPCNCNLVGVVNGKSASGVGVDSSLTVRPMTGLELGLNFSWNDLTFDADVLDGGVVLFDKGDRLQFSPKYTVGASAGYRFPLGASGLQAQVSASISETSKRNIVSIVSGSRLADEGDVMRIGRAEFSIEGPEKWAVSLFADNVTNEDGVATKVLNMPAWSTRVRPRTIGLQLDYRL